MRRRNTNVRNPDELLTGTHSKVSVKGSKPEENKLDRDPIVVRVRDGLIGIVITLPPALLQIDSESVRRDLAENFICRKLACNEYHDQRLKSIEPRAAAATCPFSGSAAFLGADFVPLGR